MKITAVAPANIAFIKYWGKKDEVLRLPENGSISMCLSEMLTTTTVEFSKEYEKDWVMIDGGEDRSETERVVKHLDKVRKLAGIQLKAKVVSENNFPSKTGLSSSASGFAALSLAASMAAGLSLSEKELSILARQGSGSACRSIPSGFVEWLDGNTSETSFATTIFPADYWEICDVVVVVSQLKKDVPTAEGMKIAKSSPFFPIRLKKIKNKISNLKNFIKERGFKDFGEMVEAEALELHAIMLTSIPSLIYLMPNSLLIMKLVKKWREEGLEAYFTVNTGQDVHILCEKKNVLELSKRLKEIEEVREVIVNEAGEGARVAEKHLF